MKKSTKEKQSSANRYLQIVFGAIVGALAGGVAVLYRILVEYSTELLNIVLSIVKSKWFYIPVFFIVLIIIAIIVAKLLKYEPLISGSGIPQFEGEMYGELDQNWFKVLWAKFVGGLLAISCGLSLGREGPSIQLGAVTAKGFAKLTHSDTHQKNILMTCGAAAGLSAAFNAPLAGVLFSIEETHKKISLDMLLPSMAASVTADFVSKLICGMEPVFKFGALPALSLNMYLLVIALGIVTGVFGVIYNRSIALSQTFYQKLTFLKPELKMCIPFITAGILGLCFPYVLGGGQGLVTRLSSLEFTILMAALILIIKFVFSMLSFGSGSPGGIFLPLLVLGSLIGTLFGQAMAYTPIFSSELIPVFVILAMAGTFTGIVKAPITGTLLLCEMTGSFTYLLPLVLVSLISYIVSDLLKGQPIYDQLLERMLSNR